MTMRPIQGKVVHIMATFLAGLLLAGCLERHEQWKSVEQVSADKRTMLTRPTEPNFDGKLLSAWLEILGRPGPWESGNWTQADYLTASNAISNLGSNSVPFLQFALATDENGQGAIAACRLLGPKAKPAVPGLVASLRAGHIYASYALIEIDPTTIPFITESFTNQNSELRYRALSALSLGPGLGVDITPARPAVLKCLEDGDGLVRNAATNLIRQMGGKLPWTDPPEGSALKFE